MILTQAFFTDNAVCAEGQVVVDTYKLIGMDIDDAIKKLLQAGLKEDAGWILQVKSSEKYVRMNGSVITMGSYQVFNPLTGLHTRHETEADAKAALIDVSKQLLAYYGPQVVQEISNENGDAVWVPTTLHETINII